MSCCYLMVLFHLEPLALWRTLYHLDSLPCRIPPLLHVVATLTHDLCTWIRSLL